MRFCLLSLLFFASSVAKAGAGSSDGVSVSMDFGVPQAQIENPDGTLAYYKGISFLGRFNVPLVTDPSWGLSLSPSVRYMDFQNTANSGSQKEIAQHLGPGVGLGVRVFKVHLGVDYHLMKARHYSIGPISNELNFDFGVVSYDLGILWTFGSGSMGIKMSQSNGKIPLSETGLTQDSSYSDTTYWFSLKYNLGVTFGKLFTTFFK